MRWCKRRTMFMLNTLIPPKSSHSVVLMTKLELPRYLPFTQLNYVLPNYHTSRMHDQEPAFHPLARRFGRNTKCNYSKLLMTPNSKSCHDESLPRIRILGEDKSDLHDNSEDAIASNTTSVFSWNILADCLFDPTRKHIYDHIQPGITPVQWHERLPMIVDQILEANSDIVCLQEVDFAAFEKDLLPALRRSSSEGGGYDGVLQYTKKRASSRNAQGLATFWKKSLYSLEDVSQRSRTMTVILKQKMDVAGADNIQSTTNMMASSSSELSNNFYLAVVNVHLEGHPLKSVERVKQLQHTLRDLSTKLRAPFDDQNCRYQGLIICGDFNCELDGSACSHYLMKKLVSTTCDQQQKQSNKHDKDDNHNKGERETTIIEWGNKIPVSNYTSIPPHIFDLRSAYPSKNIDTKKEFTYALIPGCTAAGLDQIWFTPSLLRCVMLRELFPSSWHRDTILKTGLPNMFHPSDHIPVGAIFLLGET